MSSEPKIPVTIVDAGIADVHCDLPSGRQVAIRVDGDKEQLVLVGLDGAVELQVVFTAEGPVLRMPAARIALQGADELSLGARKLRLQAEEDITVKSGGTVHMSSTGQTRVMADEEVQIEGSFIYLN